MQQIDERRLETDPAFRFGYLAGFIGFTGEDAQAIQACGPYLGPMIPQLVDKTYENLLKYDATARHFVPVQSGYDGPVPGGLGEVSQSHPQVRFRKEHLAKYFMQILGRTCDAKFAAYLDMVGKIHTPGSGNKEIDVPLVQMNALMGFLSDVLTESIFAFPLDHQTAIKTVRAFQKFLWIQNDFITRHYARDPGEGARA